MVAIYIARKHRLCSLAKVIALLCCSCILQLNANAPEFEQDAIVFFPVKIEPEEENTKLSREIFSARIQQGLQVRFDSVYFGPVVEKQLELEFSKQQCTAEECVQNVAINFATALVVEPTIYVKDDGYVVVLKYIDIEDNTQNITSTNDCYLCSESEFLKIVESLASGIAPQDEFVVGTNINTTASTSPISVKREGEVQVSHLEASDSVVIFDDVGNQIHRFEGGILPNRKKLPVGYYSAKIYRRDHSSVQIDFAIKFQDRYRIDIKELKLVASQCTVKVLNQQRFYKAAISIKGRSNGGVILDDSEVGFAPTVVNLYSGNYRIKVKQDKLSGSSKFSCVEGSASDLTIPIYDSSYKSGFKLYYEHIFGNSTQLAFNNSRVGVGFVYAYNLNYMFDVKVFSDNQTGDDFSATGSGYGVGATLFRYWILGSNTVSYSSFQIGGQQLNVTGYSEVYTGARWPINSVNLELRFYSIESGSSTIDALIGNSVLPSLSIAYKF